MIKEQAAVRLCITVKLENKQLENKQQIGNRQLFAATVFL